MKKWFLVFLSSFVLICANGSIAFADDGLERRKALSRQYVEQMQITETVRNMYADMLPEMVAEMREEDPDMTDEQVAIVLRAMDHTLSIMLPKIVSDYVDYYALMYNEEELYALISFNSSDVGRSIIAKTNSNIATFVKLNEAHTIMLIQHMFEYIQSQIFDEETS